MSKLTDSAILVSLSIGLPPKTKKAKAASEKVEVDNQTAANQAAVVKKLFAKDDTERLTKAASAARQRFEAMTLPYSRGLAILPTSAYFEFANEMDGLSAEFSSQAVSLVTNYGEALNRAQHRLGKLFRMDDYPSAEELRNRMYMSIETTVMPSGSDFEKLVGLDETEVARMQQQTEALVNDRVEQAMTSLYTRLKKTVSHAARTLKVEDKKFKNTLLSNIHDAVSAAESLNLTGDPELTALAKEVKDMVADVTVDELRKDLETREEYAEKAARISSKLANII